MPDAHSGLARPGGQIHTNTKECNALHGQLVPSKFLRKPDNDVEPGFKVKKGGYITRECGSSMTWSNRTTKNARSGAVVPTRKKAEVLSLQQSARGMVVGKYIWNGGGSF